MRVQAMRFTVRMSQTVVCYDKINANSRRLRNPDIEYHVLCGAQHTRASRMNSKIVPPEDSIAERVDERAMWGDGTIEYDVFVQRPETQ